MLRLLLLLLAERGVLVLRTHWLLKRLAQIHLKRLQISGRVHHLGTLSHHTLDVQVACVGRLLVVRAAKVQRLARHVDRVRGS